MGRLIYIYKQKKSDAAWSSAISDLGLKVVEKIERSLSVTIDNSSLSSLKKSYSYLLGLSLKKNDVLCINHAISFWLLLPLLLLLKARGIKLIFLFHEHEHILGISYCLRNFRKIKFKEYLRHFSLWYKIPFVLSSKVVCLSAYQGVSLGRMDFERLSYLGINTSRFPAKNSKMKTLQETIILFAHDPGRYDKGSRFCDAIDCISGFRVQYGRENILEYDEVFKKYHDSDITFLPSDSESYSLVLAEAMSTNSCVVTNANVGIVQLLLSIYSVEELAEYGLFVSEHSQSAYNEKIRLAENFINSNKINTVKLFEILSLDEVSSFNRFYLFMMNYSASLNDNN
jgi:glycosyltransferase involved in cell wall biosynthesis